MVLIVEPQLSTNNVIYLLVLCLQRESIFQMFKLSC